MAGNGKGCPDKIFHQTFFIGEEYPINPWPFLGILPNNSKGAKGRGQHYIEGKSHNVPLSPQYSYHIWPVSIQRIPPQLRFMRDQTQLWIAPTAKTSLSCHCPWQFDYSELSVCTGQRWATCIVDSETKLNALANLAEEAANIRNEQIRFLERGEVPARRHFGPVLQVIVFLSPSAG